jgi:hypothetical protein
LIRYGEKETAGGVGRVKAEKGVERGRGNGILILMVFYISHT